MSATATHEPTLSADNVGPCVAGLTMDLYVAILDIFSVKGWPDLEIWVWSPSRSLKMAPFDRPYATFYWSAIVNIALSRTIFEFFDVE